MPFLCVLTMASLLVAGCSHLQSTLTRKPMTIIATQPNPPMYRYNPDESPGEEIGVFPVGIGDTLKAIGYRRRFSPRYLYYMVVNGGDTIYLEHPDVMSIDSYIYDQLESTFRVPAAQDPTAWARATVYITKHADMKITTATESLIQTATPLKTSSGIGYIVTRVPMGDSVEYDITCLAGSAIASNACDETEFAFYMVTGREYEFP